MNKRRMSILLMVLTIGTIAAFQVYWLRKNYQEEQKTFTLRTNLLFRETLFRLQAGKLHLDTIVNLRPGGAPGTLQIRDFKFGLDDSTGHLQTNRSLVVSVRSADSTLSPDTLLRRGIRQMDNPKVIYLLSRLDSVEQNVTIKEAVTQFGQALAREDIHLPFTIAVRPDTSTGQEQHATQPPARGTTNLRFFADSADNRILLGFPHPKIYELTMGDHTWMMVRRMGPQLLFSLVLVGITTLSFLLLYRNWQRQHKLTLLKNDFISNITHELKTPIATVSVAVEALRNFNALQDPARTREYLDISASELQRLSLLVDKVLKLSLFERQEIELKKEPFDLCILIDEVLASMRLQFEKYQARVEFIPERPPGEEADYRLRADKLHFTSVIFNLLDNALKYSRINPFIRIQLGTEPDMLVLSVADNGPGIPVVYRDRIFEKFFRVPTGNQHDVKGYGLGLSYVSYVVQRQGGAISVDSQEGAGSTFIVKIPRDHA